MTTRRHLLFSAAALFATPAMAETIVQIPRSYLPHEMDVNPELEAGQIHVVNATHNLYWTLGGGRAIQYTTALGEAGRAFVGQAIVQRKAEWPSWVPTDNMIRLEPSVYGPYRGGLPGGHARNPLGARALYLYQNGQDTQFRIHGTPQPWTIGQSFSSGCIRLINEHIEQLYDAVPVGTRVFVS